MRILIFGAGAVGQYLAARLRLGGHDVILFARPAVAPRLREQGITLTVGSQVWPVPAGAAADVADVGLRAPIDLAIVAVKSVDTAEAASTIAAMPGCAGAVTLSIQNGLGNEELLAERFGADRVVAGALTTPVQLVEPTGVLAGARGGLTLSPVGTQPHNWVLAAFGPSGIEVRAARDWRAIKWSKLFLNLLANAVCAILDWTPAQVYGDSTAFAIERRCAREALATMRKLRLAPIDLIDYPVRGLTAALAWLPAPVLRTYLRSRVVAGRGGKLPSLLLNLRAGRRRLEVDVLNGGVAQRAAEIGAPAPANAVVARVLAGIARGDLDWDRYRGKPQVLAHEIEAM